MLQDFLSYYWLKEELQVFCRENGMSAAGSKLSNNELWMNYPM
ncbi:SAP domain-containing protein [Cytobacillus firmus]